MKIAVVSMIREPWGGSEELWADMASVALRRGYEIIHSKYAFSRIPPKEKLLIEKGLKSVTRKGFITPGLPFYKRIPAKLFFALGNMLENPFQNIFEKKPDYILYNGTCFSILKEHHLLSQLEKSKIKFGIIAHFLNKYEIPRRKEELEKTREIYSGAENIFFISERTLKDTEQCLDARLSNALVIRNPVNLESKEIVAFPKTEPVQFALVAILRVIHKGQDIVIKVLSTEKWKQRKWYLNIYGSGEDEMHLKNLVKIFNLNQQVSFHGKVENIRDVWSKNHILLMPSLMEGMPLAVVEAMLCGRPAVVTDTGGHTEWIEDNKEGWIAREATVEAFDIAIEKAWQHKNNWEIMGKNAHQKAISLYDPEPGQTLLKLIENSLRN